MCTCSSSLKIIIPQLIFIFINIFMINCQEKNYCPFIETLSFGSDIHIKCNKSYLIFNEINNDKLNWKFANQTSICKQHGTQQASINQCGIEQIGSNYLKVPLKSIENNEKACIYCRINYKPIAPLITVVKSDDEQYPLYIFNITATGLAQNESFEILRAKRVHGVIRHSYNYWFLQGCIYPSVKIFLNTSHTITFAVDDVSINRVEFIIRRCNGNCRKYDTCNEQQLHKEFDPNYFQTPDSLEKLSCNSDCLNGIIKSSTINRPRTGSSTRPTTTKTPLNSEQKIKFIILVILIGLLAIITLFIFIRCTYCIIKGKKHVYAKTKNVDPGEQT